MKALLSEYQRRWPLLVVGIAGVAALSGVLFLILGRRGHEDRQKRSVGLEIAEPSAGGTTKGVLAVPRPDARRPGPDAAVSVPDASRGSLDARALRPHDRPFTAPAQPQRPAQAQRRPSGGRESAPKRVAPSKASREDRPPRNARPRRILQKTIDPFAE
jgi:hypothetical protein